MNTIKIVAAFITAFAAVSGVANASESIGLVDPHAQVTTAYAIEAPAPATGAPMHQAVLSNLTLNFGNG